MKKILLSICTIVVLASCKSDRLDTLGGESGSANAIVFSGSSGSGKSSRTIVENNGTDFSVAWTKKDEIGIFGRSGQKSIGDNYRYAVLPDEYTVNLCKFAPFDIDKMFEWDGSEQIFSAYHPYDKSAGTNAASMPLKLDPKQVQDELNLSAHLSKYSFMKANPVTLSASQGKPKGTNLVFHNIFSIVEFKLKMNSSTSIAVPIKSIKLVSKSVNLAFNGGTIDLTTAIEKDYTTLPVTITDGSKEVELSFGKETTLTKADGQSLYMMVLAGEHLDDDLSLEVTAIDNSIATIELPAVTFKSNRNYTRSYTLALADFKQANEFDASIDNTTFRVGENVTFNLDGTADKVGFFSGEKYSEYAYAATDRKEYPQLDMSFLSQLQSGAQPTPLKVKYSTDFSGTATESDILAATWTDMSDKFVLATTIESTSPTKAADFVKMVNSGKYDITSLVPASGSLYICFFFHVDPYVTALANGRTGVYIANFMIDQSYKDLKSPQLEESKTTVSLFAGASYATASPVDTNLPTWYDSKVDGGVTLPTMFRFFSTFQPKTAREAYAVSIAINRGEERNVGKDLPTEVKKSTDPIPATYSHKYTKPGTYKVVLLGESTTLTGDKQVVKEFDITITE